MTRYIRSKRMPFLSISSNGAVSSYYRFSDIFQQ